ncbi:hypothetical protein [Methanobacterium formicicum]|nr:hypothetical protein [Methanobacterium formicicum]
MKIKMNGKSMNKCGLKDLLLALSSHSKYLKIYKACKTRSDKFRTG